MEYQISLSLLPELLASAVELKGVKLVFALMPVAYLSIVFRKGRKVKIALGSSWLVRVF